MLSITLSGVNIAILLVPGWLAQLSKSTSDYKNLEGILNPTDLEFYERASRYTAQFLLGEITECDEVVKLDILKFIHGPLVDPETPLQLPAVDVKIEDTDTIIVYIDTKVTNTISHQNVMAKQLMDRLVPIYGIGGVACDTAWVSSYIRMGVQRALPKE